MEKLAGEVVVAKGEDLGDKPPRGNHLATCTKSGLAQWEITVLLRKYNKAYSCINKKNSSRGVVRQESCPHDSGILHVGASRPALDGQAYKASMKEAPAAAGITPSEQPVSLLLPAPRVVSRTGAKALLV
jgi:hypothetical protein